MGQSLFDPQSFRSMVADKKAFAPGDSITVLIYENAQAGSSAGEGNKGDFSFTGNAGVDDKRWSAGVGVGSQNNKDAATNRKGYIRAQLTAVVTEVNGQNHLLIKGQQKIRINKEEQTISIVGVIRPQDISGDNTIPSFRIQNAQISIDGQGSVTSGKDGNVLSQFFSWLGLI